MDELSGKDFFVRPGFVCVPAEPTRFAAVTASGCVVTLFDERTGVGGIAHYVRPVREGNLSTAMFAAPAIVTLVKMLESAGAVRDRIEAHLYGGAINPDCPRYREGLSEKNASVGLEVMARLGISLAGQDVGGSRPRKIMFHSGTGEVAVIKVKRVREEDWYPDTESSG